MCLILECEVILMWLKRSKLTEISPPFSTYRTQWCSLLPPLVISMPWLSWANNAECWGATPPAWGWESSSVKTGGGPGGGGGGGGQGALGAVGGSNRQAGAMGPWRDGESQMLDSNIALRLCELVMRKKHSSASNSCSNKSLQQSGVLHKKYLKAWSQ